MRSSTINTISSGFFRLAFATDFSTDGGVERPHAQCLLPPATLDDAELDPLPGLERRDTARQGGRVHEDLTAVVAGEETETLAGVVPLDLASGHR
jgi:hypothetical protein